jgi:hypothetical protein
LPTEAQRAPLIQIEQFLIFLLQRKTAPPKQEKVTYKVVPKVSLG